MFRIERELVKIGAVKSVQTVQVNTGSKESSKRSKSEELDGSIKEAGVAGKAPDAAASGAAKAQELLNNAEARAEDILGKAVSEANARALEIHKEAETKAKKEAETIIGNARKEADAILDAAREQADAEREQVREQAHKEGYDDGAEEGRRSYDEKTETRLLELENEFEEKLSGDDAKLKAVIEELHGEWTRTHEALEDETVNLALEIARKVLDPAEDGFGDFFEMLIKNALKQINPDNKIIIRVGPSEYERFFTGGNVSYELDRGVKVTASVLRDAALEPGDCIIDTEGETLNAGLDTQLKYIRFAFDKADSI